MRDLEATILELQKNNEEIESHNVKLRTEITTLEHRFYQNDKENKTMKESSQDLEEHLTSLRRALIRSLQHIQLPGCYGHNITEQNFDQYINDLQAVCLQNDSSENRAVFNSIKQALLESNLI